MSAPAQPNIVYFFGPDTTHLSSDTRIDIKIGMSKNNPKNFAQRFGEHLRHRPNDIVHAQFATEQPDSPVRKYACSMFPELFGANRGKGREVISLLVKDVPFLMEFAKRWFNGVIGNYKLLSFGLRQEQDRCLEKTIAFFSDPMNIGREFLWDAKMRFGKTHSAYELVMMMNFGLVLILTGRPTDTKKAWIDAMDHRDFDFGKDNFIDASLQGNTPITIDLNKRTIIFASLQDLARMTENGFKDKFANFPMFVFDLIIKDEYHIAFDTAKTKNALSMLQFKHLLALSGTPFHALLEGRFDDDSKFTWSYLQEQSARMQELATLGIEKAEKDGQYYWLAPMKLHMIQLSPALYKDVDLFSEEEGFTFTKLFTVEEKEGRAVFRNDIAVRDFVNALSHGLVMPYSNQAHNCHQYAAINLKHALWYVPGVKEAKLLAAMLKTHEAFKHYDIIIAADDNGGEGNDTVELVKSRIADIENGRNKAHIGTITLTCGKLTHGVSIPEWGSVFNLSDMGAPQLYFQFIFRAQTPWKGMKRECYVFDFNPNRTLTHLHKLAEAIGKTKDIRPILEELLNMFNVLCYEDNEFKRPNISEVLAKLEATFEKSTSLIGLQNLFAELPFELDEELEAALEDIEDTNAAKIKDIDINDNDVSNGKNSKRLGDGGSKNKNEKRLEELKKLRVKQALRSIPQYFHLTDDSSFEGLVNNLDKPKNVSICKKITGLPATSLKKILSGLVSERQQAINRGIVRFRELEASDHRKFQSKLKR